MSQRYTYTIEPLEGREFIQRNFVTLPEKAFKYSNRAVSLNERFSIIERGYILVPEAKNTKHNFQRNVRLVPCVRTVSNEQAQQKISNAVKTKTKK
uniref:Transposase n=1 Tax=Elaeophora elaphi TaxID=1147741 RepID=A0A0R3RYA1_9BILA